MIHYQIYGNSNVITYTYIHGETSYFVVAHIVTVRTCGRSRHVGGVLRIFIKVIDRDNSLRILIVGLYRGSYTYPVAIATRIQ